MSEVIVNASPLIFLGNAGRLELLRPLGHRVLVPFAVHHEVTTSQHCDRAATAVLDATWLVPIAVDTIPQAVAAWDHGAMSSLRRWRSTRSPSPWADSWPSMHEPTSAMSRL